MKTRFAERMAASITSLRARRGGREAGTEVKRGNEGKGRKTKGGRREMHARFTCQHIAAPA